MKWRVTMKMKCDADPLNYLLKLLGFHSSIIAQHVLYWNGGEFQTEPRPKCGLAHTDLFDSPIITIMLPTLLLQGVCVAVVRSDQYRAEYYLALLTTLLLRV